MLGRIITRTIGGTQYDYTYEASKHVDAPTSYRGNTYSYDAAGNQTARTIDGTSSLTQTRTYDAENRLTRVISGTTTSSYTTQEFMYDANGKRLVQSVITGVTTGRVLVGHVT